VTRHFFLATLFALAAIGASLAAGEHRRGALLGSVASSLTALVSLLFMMRSARSRKPVQAALVVLVLMFFVRILVVAFGTMAVVKSGASMVAFLIAFFVPYFIFAAIEGAYVHALNRSTGTPA
jgi:Ca2+/Na+ antiporter